MTRAVLLLAAALSIASFAPSARSVSIQLPLSPSHDDNDDALWVGRIEDCPSLPRRARPLTVHDLFVSRYELSTRSHTLIPATDDQMTSHTRWLSETYVWFFSLPLSPPPHVLQLTSTTSLSYLCSTSLPVHHCSMVCKRGSFNSRRDQPRVQRHLVRRWRRQACRHAAQRKLDAS